MARISEGLRCRYLVPPWKSKRGRRCFELKNGPLIGPHYKGSKGKRELERAKIAVAIERVIAQLARVTVQPTLRQRIITSQRDDPSYRISWAS